VRAHRAIRWLWSRPPSRFPTSTSSPAAFAGGCCVRVRRAHVNYLPPSPPDRIREIYGVSYPRLARIKAPYDPSNLFRENENIRPEVKFFRDAVALMLCWCAVRFVQRGDQGAGDIALATPAGLH
jgi:hypothetical protein